MGGVSNFRRQAMHRLTKNSGLSDPQRENVRNPKATVLIADYHSMSPRNVKNNEKRLPHIGLHVE